MERTSKKAGVKAIGRNVLHITQVNRNGERGREGRRKLDNNSRRGALISLAVASISHRTIIETAATGNKQHHFRIDTRCTKIFINVDPSMRKNKNRLHSQLKYVHVL